MADDKGRGGLGTAVRGMGDHLRTSQVWNSMRFFSPDEGSQSGAIHSLVPDRSRGLSGEKSSASTLRSRGPRVRSL